MSYSTILINQRASFSLKPNVDPNCRKQRRKVVVCCCPWSESGMEKNKLVSQEKLNTNSPRKLPPTPSLRHMVGFLKNLAKSSSYHDALRDLAKKCGPLVYMEVGERSIAIVSSPKIAKEVMRTHDPAYAGKPKLLGSQILSYEDIVFHEYDEYWKQMRNLSVSELLSNKKVELLDHIKEEEGSAVVYSIMESCGSGAPFNLTEKIYLYTFKVLCRAMFGKMSVDEVKALTSVREAVDLLGGIRSVIDLFPSVNVQAEAEMCLHKLKLQKSRDRVEKMFEDLIDIEQRKRDGGGERFIDVLLRLKESGELQYPLTDGNIKSLLLDMVVGADTTSSVADWAMAELMKNPRVMAKAQDEIRQAFVGNKRIQESDIGRLKYLKLVIMETLRLHPSVPLIFRSCREEAEVDGYHIPLNADVVINAWAIGRDPMYWKNPESFEPERFEENPVNFSGTHFEFIPFGSGRRICPGKTFGLAQFEFILAQMLYHFDWELPRGISPDDLDTTDIGGIFVSRKNPLYLIAKPYY